MFTLKTEKHTVKKTAEIGFKTRQLVTRSVYYSYVVDMLNVKMLHSW